MARDRVEKVRAAGGKAHVRGTPRIAPKGLAPGLAGQWLAGWDASEAYVGGPRGQRRRGSGRRFDRRGER